MNVDSGRRVWARRAGGEPIALAWTGDGRRLVLLSAGGLRIYDRGGRLVLVKRVPGARALALHPSGRRAAVTAAGRGGTRVATVPLSVGAGRVP